MMNTAVFWILHRHQVDIPFTIMISWREKAQSGMIGEKKTELDPFSQCGKRKNLAKLLGEIDLGDDEPLKFEILSSKKTTTGSLVHGVMASSKQDAADFSGGKCSDFMARKQEIDEAVMTAFGWGPEYHRQFTFKISITRTIVTSRAERAKLVIQGLRELEVTKDVITAAQQQINEKMHRNTIEDNEKTSGSNEGMTRNTANELEMVVLGSAGVRDHAIEREDGSSTFNPLRSQINS